MKKFILPIIIVYLLGIIYLTLPSPSFPDLSGDLKSDEPGDTWQHPDQKAFFTDKNRSQVLTELQSKFSLNFMNWKIPSFRLNYRPEEVGELVRDQIPSYYLEEIIYPLRESIFVNGWEPQNSPINKDLLEKDRPQVIINNTLYRAKVTLRPVSSQAEARVLVWTLVIPSLYFLLKSWQYVQKKS